MKKTTKVLSLFLVAAFIFTMMSLSVFATDYSKSVRENTIVSGFCLLAEATYSTVGKIGSMSTEVSCVDSSKAPIEMDLYSTMTIRYADGTFGGGQNYINDGIVTVDSSVKCLVSIALDPNKIADVIYTNHRYYSDSANVNHYIFVDLFEGVDFWA